MLNLASLATPENKGKSDALPDGEADTLVAMMKLEKFMVPDAMSSSCAVSSFDHERQEGCRLIGAICFGHDGVKGYGCPVEAAARREKAASEGAFEAVIGLVNDLGEEKTNKGAPHVLKSALHALMRLCVGYDEAGSKRRRRAFNIGAIPACVAALETHFSPDVFEAVVHFNEALMRESATSQRMNPEMHAQWQEEMGRASPELKANVQRSMREKMQEKMAGMMDRGPPMPGLVAGRPLPPELAAMLGGLAGGNAAPGVPGENMPPQSGLVATTGLGQIDLAQLLGAALGSAGRP